MALEKSTILTYSMMQRQEETINKERGRLLGFIKSKVNNFEDAEDILQDVLEQFIDGYGAIESIEKATSWLFKVAGNKIIDLYRYRKVRSNQVALNEDIDEESVPLMLRDILPDLDNSPEDIYFKDLIWEEVTDALDELPEAQRQVFILHEFEDMSFKEIEKILKMPINTLISRKRYAVMALRKKLEIIYKEIGS
jgi:RNA polymerase sigma factor (sigma-70 family)